jgi:alpha/beta superfamily hydrolase
MKSPNIRSLFLPGAAGRLEALLTAGTIDAAFAALVAHPHPLFGGTMHNKVVYHAMKVLNQFSFPVLRFNFRGVGGSQGQHDDGRGEVNDVQVALEWLSHEFGKPIIFAGFSFGAAVGLRAACPDSRVAALISLGTPIAAEGRAYSYDFLRGCSKPKLFISGGSDQFASSLALEEMVRTLPEPARLVLIPHADHFFTGHLEAMRETLRAGIEEMLRFDGVAV